MLKEKIKTEYLLLGLLFIIVLAFRLFFAFRYDHFNTDDAYFHLRQINYFLENGSLIGYDELSYSGRFVFYPPLFHVLLGLASFGSTAMLKIVPEFLLALTIFIVYVIAKDISGSSYGALFAAASSAFIPMLFRESLNNISIYSFVIPLVLLMLYCIDKLENRKYLWIFIIASFIFSFTHPTALIFVVSSILYFLIIAGGAISASRIEKEGILFSSILIILSQFIVYKEAFLEFGAGILKQNIPSNILADSFRQVAPLDLLVGVGLVPLVFGTIGGYSALIKGKKKISYIFGAFSLAVLLLVSLRLLMLSSALIFLGISLSIFSSVAVSSIYNYFDKFKVLFFKRSFAVLVVVLLLVLSIYPSYTVAKSSAKIDNSKIREIMWLIKNTDENSVILANVDEGHLIQAFAGRKTVVDSNFLFAPDPIERVDDMKIIYTTVSEAVALKLIHKYNIEIIYLSDDTRREFGILDISYAEKAFGGSRSAEPSKCFDLRGFSFYVVKC